MSTSRPNFAVLSLAANLERHELSSDQPWLVLMLIQYPGTADPGATQLYLRLVRDLDPVTFDAGDGLGPQVYAPFNFTLGDMPMQAQGAVPELEIKASNVMRLLQGVIENYGGLVGAVLTLFVVNAANPAGEPELQLNFTVKQTVCTAKDVTLRLGAASPLRRLFPLFMYRPNYCMWVYNSPALQARAAADPAWRNPGKQCAYMGSMATCSKTIDGATGCQAHNNTLRFGAFPGIDSNGAAAGSVI
jgi:phage-related protein